MRISDWSSDVCSSDLDGSQGNRLYLAGVACRLELFVTLQAYLLGGEPSGFQVFARVELGGIFGHETANRASHGQADIGVDIDLAHADFNGLLDFLDRHALSFVHVADEFAEIGRASGRESW